MGGYISAQTESLVTISSVRLGYFAHEDWTFSLNGAELVWNVTRTFTFDGTVTDDRFPALGFVTSNMVGSDRINRRYSSVPTSFKEAMQIPSFVSLEDMLDPSNNQAYTLPADSWRALLGSDNSRSQRLLLSPSGMELKVELDRCRFSFARPNIVIVSNIAIAAQCAAPTSYLVSMGQTATNTMRMTFLPVVILPAENFNVSGFVIENISKKAETGHGDFSLQGMQEEGVESAIREYAKIFNMFMSSVYGNSPAWYVQIRFFVG